MVYTVDFTGEKEYMFMLRVGLNAEKNQCKTKKAKRNKSSNG